MRWMCIALVASMVSVASLANGLQAGCAGCGPRHFGGLDAEAGACPGGYTLVPGCCEDHRHCCDNAWAGYCEHRAKVDAFWSHVGTRGSYGRRCVANPVLPCESPAYLPNVGHPTPAAAVPTPAPTAPAPAIPAPPIPGNVAPTSPAK